MEQYIIYGITCPLLIMLMDRDQGPVLIPNPNENLSCGFGAEGKANLGYESTIWVEVVNECKNRDCSILSVSVLDPATCVL